MKRFTIAIVLVATLVAVLATAGFVYAQTGNPPTPQTPGSGYGYGRGQGGMMGRGAGYAAGNEGILHDTMISVFAQKLGLSVDALNTRLSNGETMAQIASAQGLTADQFTTLMTDARTQALDQAVKDGKLTQTQADWMKQRGAGMGFGAANANNGTGSGFGRGMRGMGAGNTACPYYNQTNP